MRCRDCGEDATITRKGRTRNDVCDSCWETRLELVSGKIVPTGPEVMAIQKAMASGRGRAKGLIDAARDRAAGSETGGR